ncbi:hypothetical protein JW868_00145 [Candidatus Woesearchaeota archaeon]|nr:hypothetical protein [Candidatus Woesearchaeota archaeon]
MKNRLMAIIAMAVMLLSMIPVYAVSTASNTGNPDSGNDETPEPALYADDSMDDTGDGVDEAAKLNVARRVLALREKIQERLHSLTPEQKQKLERLSASRLNGLTANSDEADLAQTLDNIEIRKIDKDTIGKVRVVAKEKLETAVQNYNQAKERYSTAKENYEEWKNKFQDYKNQEMRECSANSDSEACVEYQLQSIEAAKNHLSYLADLILEEIEKIIAKIEQSQNVDETNADEMIDNLNTLAGEVKVLKEEVETAESKEEVKEAGTKLIEIWKSIHERLAQYDAAVVLGNVNGILLRAEVLEKRIDAILSKMEEAGYDITEFDEQVEKFSDLITQARAEYDTGQKLLIQAKRQFKEQNMGEGHNNLKQAQVHFRNAHQYLKDAHNVLTELMKEFNNAGYSMEDVEDEVTYEEVPDFPEEVVDLSPPESSLSAPEEDLDDEWNQEELTVCTNSKKLEHDSSNAQLVGKEIMIYFDDEISEESAKELLDSYGFVLEWRSDNMNYGMVNVDQDSEYLWACKFEQLEQVKNAYPNVAVPVD